MARQSGLGRGLGALIPSEQAPVESSFAELKLSQITPNPNQPRGHFDEEALVALSASIREVGVLQPVLVRPLDGGRYELIAGERRWRAAKRVGLATIPAIIRDADDVSSVEQALVENLHREDLNPLEEGAAYQQLIEDFGLTHEALAERVGKSRAAISNTLRLFQLPPAIQRMLAERRLTAGHARALLGSPDRGFQEQLARQAVDEGWSVRAVEDAIRAHTAPPAGGDQDAADPPTAGGEEAKPARLRPPGLLELEELLSNYLDTRVKVQMGNRRGKVVVEFATLEDLERIYRRVTEGPIAQG